MTFEEIQKLYYRGVWTDMMVIAAVVDGAITSAQAMMLLTNQVNTDMMTHGGTVDQAQITSLLARVTALETAAAQPVATKSKIVIPFATPDHSPTLRLNTTSGLCTAVAPIAWAPAESSMVTLTGTAPANDPYAGTTVTLPAGTDSLKMQFMVPYTLTLDSIAIRAQAWDGGIIPAGSTQFPFVCLAIANWASSSFVLQYGMRCDIGKGISGTYTAGTSWLGSVTGLKETIYAKSQILICAGWYGTGGTSYLSDKYIYINGSVTFTAA